MPALHHSVSYRPDALPAAQPTALKHWRHWCTTTHVLFITHHSWREKLACAIRRQQHRSCGLQLYEYQVEFQILQLELQIFKQTEWWNWVKIGTVSIVMFCIVSCSLVVNGAWDYVRLIGTCWFWWMFLSCDKLHHKSVTLCTAPALWLCYCLAERVSCGL